MPTSVDFIPPTIPYHPGTRSDFCFKCGSRTVATLINNPGLVMRGCTKCGARWQATALQLANERKGPIK